MMSIRDYILTNRSDLLAKRGLSFDSDIEEKTYTEDELNIIRQAYDLSENSISFSERFNKYLKDREQGGIVNDVQIKPLINQKVMDTQEFITTTSYIMTGFKPLKDYAKFKTGDKVKITKDFLAFISGENVNLKGFEGVIFSSLNLVSGMYNQNSLTISYDVDINGFIVGSLQESDLELIKQPQKLEYRKDLYDIADDVDGCLLPDYQPKTELIQRKFK